MFNDGRSKRVVFVAHCFLNQNSISDGTAVYPAAFNDLVVFFLNADIGIVQMPCPELCCLGLIEEMTMEQMFLLSLKIPVFVRKCKKVKLINC